MKPSGGLNWANIIALEPSLSFYLTVGDQVFEVPTSDENGLLSGWDSGGTYLRSSVMSGEIVTTFDLVRSQRTEFRFRIANSS